MTRTVRVECTWRSTHDIEVPDDTPTIAEGDISAVLEHEDVTSAVAELTDWTVTDR